MPAYVRQCSKHANCWLIMADGQVKGHSTSKAKAEASARARNAAKYGGWKPSRRRGSKR